MTIHPNSKEHPSRLKRASRGYIGLLGAAALIAGCEVGQAGDSATTESDQHAITNPKTVTGWATTPQGKSCTATAITNSWVLVPKSCGPFQTNPDPSKVTTVYFDRYVGQPLRVVDAPNNADFSLLYLQDPILIYGSRTNYRLPIFNNLHLEVGMTLYCTYALGDGAGSARVSVKIDRFDANSFYFVNAVSGALPVELPSGACSLPKFGGEQLVGLAKSTLGAMGWGYMITPNLDYWIVVTTNSGGPGIPS